MTFYLLPEKKYSKKTKKNGFLLSIFRRITEENSAFSTTSRRRSSTNFFLKNAQLNFRGGFGGLWGLCDLPVQSYSHLTGKIPQMGEMDTQELKGRILYDQK